MTIDEYISRIPAERVPYFQRLRETIQKNLPEGFEERAANGTVGYVVPHSLYAPGYHCDPKSPLPFVNLASQARSINLYHMGLYADKALSDWFVAEFPGHSAHALDMGKSCVRFKYLDDIPYDLVAQLMRRMSVKDWIARYETLKPR